MTVPVLPLILTSAVLGLLIGSFLNVVIWRVPRGESVVSPPSHCPACDAELSALDNVPLLSWLVLRGKCRHCSVAISARYPTVEFLTAVLFGAVAWRLHGVGGNGLPRATWFALAAFLAFTALAVALSFIDYDTKRLPNVLTLPAYPAIGALLTLDAVVSGDWSRLIHGAIGMAALFAFYFVLVVVYPAGMGGGDVKLSGLIGLVLGWLGFGTLIVGAFLGFLLGGLWGIALIMAKRGGRKTAVPYGPFMLLGAMIGIFVGQTLASAYVNNLG